MSNPYKKYLDQFLTTMLEFIHSARRIDTVLKRDLERYKSENAKYIDLSHLIIRDWTEELGNEDGINFPTGIIKEVGKEDYENEVKKMISFELCTMLAQSFENLERFIKNCLFEKAISNQDFALIIQKELSNGIELTRENLPGGNRLYKLLKKGANPFFGQFSDSNNIGISFKNFWIVITELRHAITHSNSILDLAEIKKKKDSFKAFESFVSYHSLENEHAQIVFEFNKFRFLMVRVSEFGYQVFKAISTTDGYDLEYGIRRH